METPGVDDSTGLRVKQGSSWAKEVQLHTVWIGSWPLLMMCSGLAQAQKYLLRVGADPSGGVRTRGEGRARVLVSQEKTVVPWLTRVTV